MKRRLLIIFAVGVGIVVTGLLVAASIWPVINVVETGKTPQYPSAQPHYYTAEPKRVFDESKAGIESMERWKLVSSDPARNTIEATHETYLLGFIDDVTVRVEPVTEFVTRVSVRSASRVGKGDFGQNARNIRQFLDELDSRLGAVKFDPDRLDSSKPPATPSEETDAGQ